MLSQEKEKQSDLKSKSSESNGTSTYSDFMKELDCLERLWGQEVVEVVGADSGDASSLSVEPDEEKVAHHRTPSIRLNANDENVSGLFECAICYEVILPPIMMCTSGHSVCNECKKYLTRCPTCRGDFTNVRNRLAEELLEKCSIRCRFQNDGCSVRLPGGSMVAHQKDCSFRPLQCWICAVEIPRNSFLTHLQEEELLVRHDRSFVVSGFEIAANDKHYLSDGIRNSFWEPIWIHYFGCDFFCFLEVVKAELVDCYDFFIWIGAYACKKICANYKCIITVWNSSHTEKMTYEGKVHSIRCCPEEVLATRECLFLSNSRLKEFRDTGGITVSFGVSHRLSSFRTIEENAYL